MIRTTCVAAVVGGLLCASAAAHQDSELSFKRVYSASGTVVGSLEESAAMAGVPPSAMVEALQAFATAIDPYHDIHDGDRFYVKYEEEFTIDGHNTGSSHVFWAELRLRTRSEPVSIHRFRALGEMNEALWLANGLSTRAPAIQLPVKVVAISSGYGLRADPFDQLPGIVLKNGLAKAPANNNSLLHLASSSARGAPVLAHINVPLPRLRVPEPSLVSTKNLALHQPMEMHEGIDLVAPLRAPIFAAGSGIVLGAAPHGHYGNWIQIEHVGGLVTVYGHLGSFAPDIEPGVYVQQGDLIGYVGMTGRTTGPHVHFELHVDGHPVDPMKNPALRRQRLQGLDFERFRRQVARDLAEREREINTP
jgi:murein DD-endopeptidase MepM/ murein hydrolase activator NlpD